MKIKSKKIKVNVIELRSQKLRDTPSAIICVSGFDCRYE